MLFIKVKDTNIIKGFSDVFEQPSDGDICIDKGETRHFHIEGEINPELCTKDGVYFYKYIDGEIIKKTDEEIQSDVKEPIPIPIPIPDPIQEQLDILISSMQYIMTDVLPLLMS